MYKQLNEIGYTHESQPATCALNKRLSHVKSCDVVLYAQYHLSPAIVGLVFLASPGSYAIASPVWGYLVDRMVRCCMLHVSVIRVYATDDHYLRVNSIARNTDLVTFVCLIKTRNVEHMNCALMTLANS